MTTLPRPALSGQWQQKEESNTASAPNYAEEYILQKQRKSISKVRKRFLVCLHN